MPSERRKLGEALEPTRVREIGEAALRVVARKGLEGATMQEIADEAGLAKGTLYLYFDGRDELVVHLAEPAFEELRPAVADALRRGGTAAGRLEAAIRTHVEFFEHRRDLFRLFLSVAHPGSVPERSARIARSGHPLYLAYLELLASFFSEGQALGEMRAFPPDRLALFVAEGLAGVILRRLGEPDPPSVEEDVRLVVEPSPAGSRTGGLHEDAAGRARRGPASLPRHAAGLRRGPHARRRVRARDLLEPLPREGPPRAPVRGRAEEDDVLGPPPEGRGFREPRPERHRGRLRRAARRPDDPPQTGLGLPGRRDPAGLRRPPREAGVRPVEARGRRRPPDRARGRGGRPPRRRHRLRRRRRERGARRGRDAERRARGAARETGARPLRGRRDDPRRPPPGRGRREGRRGAARHGPPGARGGARPAPGRARPRRRDRRRRRLGAPRRPPGGGRPPRRRPGPRRREAGRADSRGRDARGEEAAGRLPPGPLRRGGLRELARVANKNFLPSDDEGQFDVVVRAPEGSSSATTRTIPESIATRTRPIPGVTATLLTIGDDPQLTQSLGTIYVKLAPVKDRDEDQFQIMERVRREILPQYEPLGLRAQVSPVNAFSGGSNAEIQFWIGGPDLAPLAEYSNALLETMKAVPGVVDADTNLVEGKPELGVRIDRAKAADLGVNVQDLATTLNVLVGDQMVSDSYEGGEQFGVRARAEERDRSSSAALAQARVPGAKGTVALRDVVTLEEGTGPSLVNRIARQRQVLLSANVKAGFSSQAVIDALNAKVAELAMPAGYSSGLTGRSREQGKAAAAFLTAFVLSIVFMYLILAAQFESWVHPVSILLALPLTVPFALLSIVVLDQSIHTFSSLGILVLFGIVKKNGILQIDNMIALRNQGVERGEAILRANRDRLRPILMTTLALVAGMLPLVVSSGVGSGTNRAIASVIIGGQTLALVLTLVGTPVAYSLFDDWSVKRPLRSLLARLPLRRAA